MVPCKAVSSFQRILRKKMENIFFVEDLISQILNRSTVGMAGDKL